MPSTYEPIATTTLGSATNTITFSSISSAYTDLRLVLVVNTGGNGNDVTLRFNGDTGTNYSNTRLTGSGTAASSSSLTSQPYATISAGGLSTTIPTMYTVDVFSYAGSTYKTALGSAQEDKNGSGAVNRSVNLWRSTSAINSVTFFNPSGNFNTGTTATIWGIKAA